MLVQIRGRPHVTNNLRELLESVDLPAILLDRDYRILASNQAYQDHYRSTPAEGTDHCFQVSHGYDAPCDERGESCPLRASLASEKPERVFHVHHGPDGSEHVDVELRPLSDEEGNVRLFMEVITPITQASPTADGEFVGRSRPFVRMLELLQRGAKSEVPVLLLGESGTGKELAARALHDASLRRAGPFVPVECSGLGESLFESELFGHAKGAFTGAHVEKRGLVEAARRGTLFLDEIGDVPHPLQVKLLRLLESGTYRRVGDVVPRRADFRLVCATHRNLDAMVKEGVFRPDLYYRINAFPVCLPTLRERTEDVALLAKSLLRRSGKQLSAGALSVLEAYDFPGNVRELRNVLERATLLADGFTIEAGHLPERFRQPRDAGASTPKSAWPWGDGIVPLEVVEQRYLAWALTSQPEDRKMLAQRLGLSERTLYRKLRALRINTPHSAGAAVGN